MKQLIPIIAILWLTGCAGQLGQNISNFDECVKAGNPIMESYPRQCRTEDGQLFTEKIEKEMPENCIPDTGESPEDFKQRCIPPPDLQYDPQILEPEETTISICEDLCGDGECQEIVCMGSGCPCAETAENCAEDCG